MINIEECTEEQVNDVDTITRGVLNIFYQSDEISTIMASLEIVTSTVMSGFNDEEHRKEVWKIFSDRVFNNMTSKKYFKGETNH